MGQYRSAMGKMIDMESLAAKNEKVRAVSNMSVNSRGDTIDSHGNIIKSINEKVNEHYNNTVGNRSAQQRPNGITGNKQQTSTPKTAAPQVQQQPKVDMSQLNEFEQEIESNLAEELEIEKIKAQGQKK